MRTAIIACALLAVAGAANLSFAQELAPKKRASTNPSQPRYIYIAEKGAASSSYWPSWKMPSLWPTGLGTKISSGTQSSWNTVKSGSSRAWYSTQYTLAPWSKPKPRSLTGSRGVSSGRPKSKAAKETSASWWPKLDFWNTQSEPELKSVGDWQDLGSPAAGFDGSLDY